MGAYMNQISPVPPNDNKRVVRQRRRKVLYGYVALNAIGALLGHHLAQYAQHPMPAEAINMRLMEHTRTVAENLTMVITAQLNSDRDRDNEPR